MHIGMQSKIDREGNADKEQTGARKEHSPFICKNNHENPPN
jgi:hypothetical protein